MSENPNMWPSTCAKSTDTPETDDTLYAIWYRGRPFAALPDKCRQMERERNILKAREREVKHLVGALLEFAQTSPALSQEECKWLKDEARRLGLMNMSEELHDSLMRCPFCGENDFDAQGLKAHLLTGCRDFANVKIGSIPGLFVDDDAVEVSTRKNASYTPWMKT